MFYKLRILFTVLSALCLIALLPMGTFFGLSAFIPTALCAGIFFFVMLFCKQEQEKREPEQEENSTKEQISSKEDTSSKK